LPLPKGRLMKVSFAKGERAKVPLCKGGLRGIFFK
jgi:hypothetical protein